MINAIQKTGRQECESREKDAIFDVEGKVRPFKGRMSLGDQGHVLAVVVFSVSYSGFWGRTPRQV